MSGVVLCVGCLIGGIVSSDQPLVRFGLLSDTHVSADQASCDRLRGAYAYFLSRGVDVVINCGDVADRFIPAAYGNYRETVRSVCRDSTKTPKEIFVYAGHDEIGFPSGGYEGDTNAYSAIRRCLGITNRPWDRFELGGFVFLVFPQFGPEGYVRYESAIATACAASGNRPVFVIEHVPGFGTTQASGYWGDAKRTRILSRYPQVIAIAGHAHGTMYDERNLWQGDYTSVNVAGMTHYRPDAVGVPNDSRQSGSVLCAELFADRIVFHRRDIVNNCDCGEPWMLNFANREPMKPDRRFTVDNVPSFATDAKLKIEFANGMGHLSFPSASGSVRAYRLLVEMHVNGAWRKRSIREQIADYDQPPSRRRQRWRLPVPQVLFEGDGEIRVTVEPVGFGSYSGSGVSETFTALQPTSETIACARVKRVVGNDVLLDVPGFSELSGCVTLVLDLAVSQRPGAAGNIRITSGRVRLADRLLLPTGSSDLRYAFDLKLPKKGLSDELILKVFGKDVELKSRNVKLRFLRKKADGQE